MEKRIVAVILIIVAGICFCFSKMVGCEMNRHRTYAPSIFTPDSSAGIQQRKLNRVPVEPDQDEK